MTAPRFFPQEVLTADKLNLIADAVDALAAGGGSGGVTIASADITDSTTSGRALLTGASAAAQRTSLGLGSLAIQAADSVAITGGSIAGITDLAVADGGTGASTAQQARVNLLPNYAAQVGWVLSIKLDGSDVEWVPQSGGGTVSSVDITSTDLTVTGGPVTASGAFTLGLKTVPVAKGGTGATDIATARSNLGLATVAATGAYANLTGTPTIPTTTSQLTNNSGFLTSADGVERTANKGQVSGYAGLDGAAKVPTTQLPVASTAAVGAVQLATTAEAQAGVDATKAVTPTGLAAGLATVSAPPAATTTVSGIVELATTAEASAGTDTVRAVTPAGLSAAISSATGFVATTGGTMTGTLTLRAGSTSAGTAPLTFQAGSFLSTPLANALEWNGTNLSVTQPSGPTRKTIAYTDSSISGNAANVTGTVGIGNGGTGSTSASAARSALGAAASANFSNSLAGGSGYTKMEGGVVLQWGDGVTSSGGSLAISFPIPFPTAYRQIVATAFAGAAGTAATVFVGGQTNSGFTCYSTVGGTAGAIAFGWIAVGF